MGLYFVVRGEVKCHLAGNHEIYTKQVDKYSIPKKLIRNYKAGSFFGEFSFFTHNPREITAKSTQVSNLLYLDLELFLETLNNFPDDKVY